ncbi:MAG: spore germination protein, partial [Oscillibacter sp.]|nr:spore germination protein [Oscillibacter sp.]
MEQIGNNYQENVQWFDRTLGVGRSCDMVSRDLRIGGKRARVWVVDGFGGDAILERMGAFWLSLKPEAVEGLTDMQSFLDRCVT